jgi:hypothetical protein
MVQRQHTFDTRLVTAAEIKEAADVPPDFALYRKGEGRNEGIADDADIELRNGDHFFARPCSR